MSYEYGFWAIDGADAVNLAVNWKPVGNEVSVTSGLQNVIKMIPDGNEKGIKANTTLSENIIVEKAEVICDATHPDWSDFTIKLISPSGTESVLANPIPQTPNSSGSDEIVPDYSQWKFMSLRHRGELSQGELKLPIIDNNVNQLEGCGTIGSSIFTD